MASKCTSCSDTRLTVCQHRQPDRHTVATLLSLAAMLLPVAPSHWRHEIEPIAQSRSHRHPPKHCHAHTAPHVDPRGQGLGLLVLQKKCRRTLEILQCAFTRGNAVTSRSTVSVKRCALHQRSWRTRQAPTAHQSRGPRGLRAHRRPPKHTCATRTLSSARECFLPCDAQQEERRLHSQWVGLPCIARVLPAALSVFSAHLST